MVDTEPRLISRPHDAILLSGRARLRQATHKAHMKLHAAPGFHALLQGDITIEHYRALLLRLYGLHLPLDRRIARHAGNPWLDWRSDGTRSAAARLRQDLISLGDTPTTLDSVPSADATLPAMSSPAEALGCAWVLEGSALGGRVMARHLQALFPSQASGQGFFTTDPGQPARWASCCDAVEHCSADEAGFTAMAATATQIFEAFDTWLARP